MYCSLIDYIRNAIHSPFFADAIPGPTQYSFTDNQGVPITRRLQDIASASAKWAC